MDSGSAVLLLLLDLSAAFDTIDHQLLLHRLHKEVGITGIAHQWRSGLQRKHTKCCKHYTARRFVGCFRQKESTSQEALIVKLQSSLAQLTEKCKVQEQVEHELEELKKKTLEKEQTAEKYHQDREQQQQQSRMKNETITELEIKLKQLKQDYSDDRSRWQERRQALETSLDEVQRELIQARAEKSEAVRNHAAMETKVEDLQMMVSRLEGEVEMERERVQKQREREEELRVKVLGLEGKLGNKQQEVERLERMLDVIKQEASVQMQDRVASAEKQERDRYVEQITSLSSQLTTANEKIAKLTVDLERARMEEDSLRQQLGDMRLDLQERDHYRRLVEEKSEEVSQLRSSVERATMQLEEKEKILSTVQQQSSSITHLMEVNSR
nr:hypothetical protein BaRGS_033274 [Batillaria attramentaria]